MKHKAITQKRRVKKFLIFGLLVILALEVISLFSLPAQISNLIKGKSDKNIFEYAQQVVKECKDKAHRSSCYDKQIPKLMDEISMEEAFEVTKKVQDLDGEYGFCHVLGHELSAREVRKDPNNWKEVLSRCPSGVCSNGCLHGGLQEKFRDVEKLTDEQIKSIENDLRTLCEKRDNWDPTGVEQGSCYHALGHLTMYMVDAEVDRALEICDETTLKDDGRDFRQLCYDGVFMQIYQPLEPEDFALVEGKQPSAENVEDYCMKYDIMPRASCRSESWPLFFEDLKNDPKNLESFCAKSDYGYEDRCYLSIIYVLTSLSNLDKEEMTEYCANINDSRRDSCFANVASRMIEIDYRNIDKSIEVCNVAEDYGVGDFCYEEMIFYSKNNFHIDSSEYFKVCNSLPDKWKEECLSNSTS